MRLKQILEFGMGAHPTKISHAQFDASTEEQFNSVGREFELSFLEAVLVDSVEKEYTYTQRNKIRNLVNAGLAHKDEEGNYSVTEKGKIWLKGFRDNETNRQY